MKTNRSVQKRFKKSKKGKILRRYSTQDHFNARESGKTKRRKRRVRSVAKQDTKKLKQLVK
ncbi:50S ribosomal protein L35 [Patescibacteria group bacterium]